jgi:exosome complex component MTR3
VLQDDGSAFAAAVTCASAALANAGVQMFDIVTGCSAKVQDDQILLDPTLDEEQYHTSTSSLSSGLLTIALMPSRNEVAFISLRGEVDAATLVKATRLCSDGCVRVHEVVRQSLVQSISQRQT